MDHDWKRGLPPGDPSQEMLDTFEVHLSPIGAKWHRRRTDREIERVKQSPSRYIFKPDAEQAQLPAASQEVP